MLSVRWQVVGKCNLNSYPTSWFLAVSHLTANNLIKDKASDNHYHNLYRKYYLSNIRLLIAYAKKKNDILSLIKV